MDKTKLFIENMIIYGLGGTISKIIPIIMVPIITRIMPNSEYFGINDITLTLTSIGSVLVVLGIYDGLFRLYFEKEDIIYKKTTCSTALFFTSFSSILIFLVMFTFQSNLANLFFGDNQYQYMVSISAISILIGSTNQIVAAPTRMQNKRSIYLIISIVSPIISYSLAIFLLKLQYYTTALPIAALISSLLIEIFYIVYNKEWFNYSYFNIEILKQMLIVGIPLVPNFLIYWIFNSSDKLMIRNILGLSEAGIYSVGSKLGHCSQLIYGAFAGGWSYFVFSTMKDQDQVTYNSKLFEMLAVISYISTIFICVISEPLFIIIFPKEYHSGFIVAPYLFICPLLLMLYQISSSQFTIVKKTWNNMLFLSLGAIVNIIFNIILIPILNIEGAAIATLLGYICSLLLCLIILVKKNLFKINRRFIYSSILMMFFLYIWRSFLLHSFISLLLCASVFIVTILTLYTTELMSLFKIKI